MELLPIGLIAEEVSDLAEGLCTCSEAPRHTPLCGSVRITQALWAHAGARGLAVRLISGVREHLERELSEMRALPVPGDDPHAWTTALANDERRVRALTLALEIVGAGLLAADVEPDRSSPPDI